MDRTADRLSTGNEGLDEVLQGGFITGRSYMLRGAPGAGKTLIGLSFLRAGADSGDDVLFINLEETEDEIRTNAASVGIDIDGIDFLDLTPGSEVFAEEESYDIFDPSEVEQEKIATKIADRIRSLEPSRVFVDPMTQLRQLAPDQYQFRKQVLSFARFVDEQDVTVLFTTQPGTAVSDEDLQFIADGTIELDEAATGRVLRVPKFRGSSTRSGGHTLRIHEAGLDVYPELQPNSVERDVVLEDIPSGVPALDELLHGGIVRGTATILSGPSGVGKTTAGTQFMKEAAGRGRRSVIYLFEENEGTFLARSEAIGMPVNRMRDEGTLAIKEIEPLDLSPQEFAQMVRHDVEVEDTGIIMIDGIDGYTISLRGEAHDLRRRIHALVRYLKNAGVTAILIDEVPNVTGEFQATEGNISYLADTLMFLRHLEIEGELHKVVGVLKKRTSDFERTLRHFEITEHGIKVGEPLTNLRGIMQGTPEWVEDSPDQDAI